MKKYIFLTLALAAALACIPENGFVEALELGVAEMPRPLSPEAGNCSLSVLSDGPFTATVTEGDWLSFAGTDSRRIEASGDCSLDFVYQMNRGMTRNAELLLERGRKSLRLTFSQDGFFDAGIIFPDGCISLDSSAGTGSVKVQSLYRDNELVTQVSYDGESGWISDLRKVNNFICFSVSENSSAESRTAVIRLSCKSDGSISDSVQILQLGNGLLPQSLTFSQLRDMLTLPSYMEIDETYVIEGIVSGDNAEGNGGENLNISSSIQDLSLSERTLYIQSEDGSLGFRVILDSAQDNITSRYDHIRLMLKGAELKCFDNPLRYDIVSVNRSNILSLRQGSPSDLPVKEMSIAELADEDIYTYVTLRDCEIPVRKGPFVPIDLRHTRLIHSYPMVLRDINGDNSHIMTNLTAAWQRDGEGLPQGAGRVSGVVVHETCDNFEWDQDIMNQKLAEGLATDYITGTGDIGRYQIRPFSKSEIDLAPDFEDGFSALLMEIRYYNRDNDEIVRNFADGKLYSTWPPVANPMVNSAVKGCLEAVNGTGETANMLLWRDWTHLGPVENGEISDPYRGNGVLDYYGVKAEWEPYSGVAGTALIMKSSAWYSNSDWKTLTKAWTAIVNTEDLTSANFPLSVQFGVFNGLGQSIGAPRHWRLEYSTDGVSWTAVSDYTVPDFPVLSNRKVWQCPGPKYISITLPKDAELLGKAEVRIRVRPYVNKGGTPTSYDGGGIVGGRETAMNYFAIRYNK